MAGNHEQALVEQALLGRLVGGIKDEISQRIVRVLGRATQTTLSTPVGQRSATGMLIVFFVLLALTLRPTDRVGDCLRRKNFGHHLGTQQKADEKPAFKCLISLVGAAGFEPATPAV